MRIRTILAAAAAPAALAAVLLGTAGQASAATTPHLTGSVALAGPADQWAALNNIAAGNPTAPGAPGSGSLSYTNFNVADLVNTGVGSLPKGTPVEIDFGYQGGNYPHHLIVDTIQPTSLSSFTFTGNGSYDKDGSYTWTATGSVSGETLNMHIVYTGTQAGYYLDFAGTINPDGSVTGTSFSDSLGRTLTVGMPAGSAFQALSFNSPVDHVSVTPSAAGGDAGFSAAIPALHTYAGTPFTETVHDGGSPGSVYDTWSQNPAGASTITAGNLTVH